MVDSGREAAIYRRQTCRVCDSRNLTVFLDYGDMPLAGNFVLPSEIDTVRKFPLDLAVCHDCSLVQVLNVVSPAVLFTDYRYLSSVTQTLREHFRGLAEFIRSELLDGRPGWVVEIGCNDGVLLEPLRSLGIPAMGVDAAGNVVEIARFHGHRVVHGLFGEKLAGEIAEGTGPADVITASNVFAHIDDLTDVMRGVEALLAPDGAFVVEVHYVVDLLTGRQFDTIYHEHLCYYSVHALKVLFERFGFAPMSVHRLPMHGGAIRVVARHAGRSATPDGSVDQTLDLERRMGIAEAGLYSRFGEEVVRHRDRLRSQIVARRLSGRSLSAYGAAGRATILLNYCGLDASLVQYVVDESPFRVGRYVPGVLIPIVPAGQFRASPTDDCLITAWNYRDEIVSTEAWYLNRGGCFIIPLPELEFVTA